MKISIQTGNVIDTLGYERGYALFRQAGFEAIDWNLDHSCKKADLREGSYFGKCIFERSLADIRAHYKEELGVIRKNNLEITQAHAPYPPYVPGRPELIEYVSSISRRMIEFVDEVGCKRLVIHGISPLGDDNSLSLDDVRAMNIRFYSSLIPTLLEHDVTVCLENLASVRCRALDRFEGCCSDPDDAVDLIDTLNEMAGREVFGLCLDTGHLNLLRRDPRRYIAKVGHRIKATHLHDNSGNHDDHIAPLTGTINWKFLCESLHDVGYSGDLSFETFIQTDRVLAFSEDLVLPWLVLLNACGQAFAKVVAP